MGDKLSEPAVNETDEIPNIVLIHCHDLGQHLGCYGEQVETPHIDTLASEGALFTNHFATAPQCSPSRGSIHTGQYPHSNGLMGLASKGNWRFNEGVTPLAALLQEWGYETYLIGVQHAAADASSGVNESGRPERLGFEHIDSYNNDTHYALDVAESFEEKINEISSNSPFFATLGFDEPHRPYRREYIPEEAYDYYKPETVEPLPYLPDRRGIREDLSALKAMISETVDPAVGQILRTISEKGIEENTIIVFTTDHGIDFPRAKLTSLDPGIETALVMRYPDIISEEQEFDELLNNVDLLPTLCDLLGKEPPENVDGKTFLPLIQDGDYEPRDHVFTEMTWHGMYDPKRSIRTENYKYIRSFWVMTKLHPANNRAARSIDREWYTERRPMEQLYHLESDPHEQDNLASDRVIWEPEECGSDPDHKDALEKLREKLFDWMEETDDPLLDGPSKPPFPGLDFPP